MLLRLPLLLPVILEPAVLLLPLRLPVPELPPLEELAHLCYHHSGRVSIHRCPHTFFVALPAGVLMDVTFTLCPRTVATSMRRSI